MLVDEYAASVFAGNNWRYDGLLFPRFIWDYMQVDFCLIEPSVPALHIEDYAENENATNLIRAVHFAALHRALASSGFPETRYSQSRRGLFVSARDNWKSHEDRL